MAKLFELMKVYESIGVMDTSQMPIPQDLKSYNRVRMSMSKDARIRRNSTGKLFRLMKEYKSMQVTSNMKMPIHQESKLCTQFRM
jgi:hypothetical protein